MFYRGSEFRLLCQGRGILYEPTHDGYTIRSQVVKKGFYEKRVSCTLTPYPSCCGSMFLSSIGTEIYRKGHALELLKFVDDAMVVCGYTHISCIIPEIYKEAEGLFKKAGWKKVRGMRYKNKRTGNWLNTWKKEYSQEP